MNPTPCTSCGSVFSTGRQLMTRPRHVPEMVNLSQPADVASYQRRDFHPAGGPRASWCWRCCDNELLYRLATDVDRLRHELSKLEELGQNSGSYFDEKELVHAAKRHFDRIMPGSLHVALVRKTLVAVGTWRLFHLMIQSSLMMNHGDVQSWHAGGWYLVAPSGLVEAIAGNDRHAVNTLTYLAQARAAAAKWAARTTA